MLSRFADADRDAECPHLGGDEHVTDLQGRGRGQETIDADVLIFSAGERQPDFNQADCHDLTYNTQDRPQFFSVMDACGLLWRERMFHNPAYTRSAIDKDKRVLPESGVGSLENMHYHARILAEAAAVARCEHDERCAHDLSQTYEVNVKWNPEVHFGVSLIGKMLDESPGPLPAAAAQGTLLCALERVRSLPIMFATMDCYSKAAGKSFSKVSTTGAATSISGPISHHYYQLFQSPTSWTRSARSPSRRGRVQHTYFRAHALSHSVLKVDRLTADSTPTTAPTTSSTRCRARIPRRPCPSVATAARRWRSAIPRAGPSRRWGTRIAARTGQARFGHTGPLDLGELPLRTGILQDAFAYSGLRSGSAPRRWSGAQPEDGGRAHLQLPRVRATSRCWRSRASAPMTRPSMLSTAAARRTSCMYSGALSSSTTRARGIRLSTTPISASQRSNSTRSYLAYAHRFAI